MLKIGDKKLINAWAFYDWANSVYSLVISTAVFPIYYSSMTESFQSLDEKGAITLMEGITNIPGVSQVSTGVGIEKPVIRGLRGNRVLVYNQGIRQENQQFGDEHGLGINDFRTNIASRYVF